MNIVFEEPLKFSLDVAEIDENSATIKLNLDVEISQFNQRISYNGSFWLSLENLKSFKETIFHREDSTLTDIEGYFSFEIKNDNSSRALHWKNIRRDLTGNRQVEILFSASLDADSFERIRSGFIELQSFFDS